jgi:hypothetical protein
LQGLEGDAIGGALFAQGLGECLHAGSILGGGQQDFGAPRGHGQCQADEQQAAAPELGAEEGGHP